MASNLLSRIRSIFRDGSLSNTDLDNYDDNASRIIRAILFRGFYEDTVYRDVFPLASQFKKDYGTYTYIRSIYNPAWRIGRFYFDRIFLGSTIEEAFPIEAPEGIKEDIYRVLRLSNFLNIKGSIGSLGSIQGDVYLWNRYNPHLRIFEMVVLRSDQVLDIQIDTYGQPTSYQIVVPKLRGNGTEIEIAELDGEVVTYSRYDRVTTVATEERIENIPFLPIAPIAHAKDGNIFGHSEVKPKLTAFVELDSLSSNLGDYIAVMVNAPWLLAGVRSPKAVTETEFTLAKTSVPVIYSKDPSARPHALVANLPIDDTIAHIANLLQDLENTYPELRLAAGLSRTSGDLSGRALKVSRQEAEDKVLGVRANYDLGMYKALTQNLYLNSRTDSALKYKYNKIDPLELLFETSQRPVFEISQAEKYLDEQGLWTAVNVGQKSGADPSIILARLGWSDEEILNYTNSDSYRRYVNNLTIDTNLPDPFRPEPNIPFEDSEND